MKDWDQRVEEAAKANAYTISDTDDRGFLQYIDDPHMVQAFTAGANFARGLLTDTPGGKRIYAALNEIDALRQQCEVMAQTLEKLDEWQGKQSCNASVYEIEDDEFGMMQYFIHEALAQYKKFKEGG